MLGKKKYHDALSIDRKSKKTTYVAIRDEILRLRLPANALTILLHLLNHSEKYMPPRRQLVKDSGLSRTSVDKALSDLQRQDVVEIEYSTGNIPKYRLRPLREWKQCRPSLRKAASTQNLRKGSSTLHKSFEFKYSTIFKRHLTKATNIFLQSSIKDLVTVQWSFLTVLANTLTHVEICTKVDLLNSKIYKILVDDWVEWVQDYISGSSEYVTLLPSLFTKEDPIAEVATWTSYLDIRFLDFKLHLLSLILEQDSHPLNYHRKRLVQLLAEIGNQYSTSELNALTEENVKAEFLKKAHSHDISKLCVKFSQEWTEYSNSWDKCTELYGLRNCSTSVK